MGAIEFGVDQDDDLPEWADRWPTDDELRSGWRQLADSPNDAIAAIGQAVLDKGEAVWHEGTCEPDDLFVEHPAGADEGATDDG